MAIARKVQNQIEEYTKAIDEAEKFFEVIGKREGASQLFVDDVRVLIEKYEKGILSVIRNG